MAKRTPLSHDDYTVGWICALPLEMAAAKLMMDTIHPHLPSPSTDHNAYILGNIGKHNIVIACLPGGAYGNVSAAMVATQLLSSFHSIRFGLMVGIGGGVPSQKADIRLGDIVVSQPMDAFGGVIQYDLGKVYDGRFQRIGMLNRPPQILLTALATLQAHHLTEDSRVIEFISNIQSKTASHKATKFTRPTQEDCLYQAEYNHGTAKTCANCDRSKLVHRSLRSHEEPVIHYGLIASANQVVKDGRRRDQLAQDLGVYCVEMEAAGLMNDFPCVVVRGICDYADSHKNKEWQGFAAAVAAAYAKELLLVVPINQVVAKKVDRRMYGLHNEMGDARSQYVSGGEDPITDEDTTTDEDTHAGNNPTVRGLVAKVNNVVKASALERFFNGKEDFIQEVARNVAELENDTSTSLGRHDLLPKTIKVSLYQQVIYCDDSIPMRLESRWNSQRSLVERISRITTRVLPKDEGVALRFINQEAPKTMSLRASDIECIFEATTWGSGRIPVGTYLKSKILKPLVYEKLALGLERPLLITIILNGGPEQEPFDTLRDAIVECRHRLASSNYPKDSVKFVIGQVGTDWHAESFLERTRKDTYIADMVYCISERLDERLGKERGNNASLDRWLIETLFEPFKPRK